MNWPLNLESSSAAMAPPNPGKKIKDMEQNSDEAHRFGKQMDGAPSIEQ
jgi:hypothetical protein